MTAWRRGSFLRNVQTSLGGSLIPAAIGVLATFMLGRTPHRSAAAIVLVAWSVVGYLSITDFGLSRSASRLVADGREAITSIVASLWRASLALGAGMAVVVAVLMALFGDAVGAGRQNSLWLLTVAPVVSALQFPVIGLLEAKGEFKRLAAQRIGNALCTYMVPALLVVVNDSLVWVSIVLLVGYRICALIWLWRITGIPLIGVWQAFRSAGGGSQDRGSVRRVAPWVAASSLIGSFYLYVDRGLLAISGPRVDVWVTYVAISELMLKTYLIPSATLSVAFPWLIGNFKRRRLLVRQLFAIWGTHWNSGLGGLRGRDRLARRARRTEIAGSIQRYSQNNGCRSGYRGGSHARELVVPGLCSISPSNRSPKNGHGDASRIDSPIYLCCNLVVRTIRGGRTERGLGPTGPPDVGATRPAGGG